MNLEGAVPPRVTLEPQAKAELKQQIMGTIGAEATVAGARAANQRRRFSLALWHWRSMSAVVAAALAIVLLAGVLAGKPSPPAQASSLSQAASNLDASTVARATSGSLGVSALSPGQYVYQLVETADEVITEVPSGGVVTYLSPQTLQTWRRTDGSGVSQNHPLAPVFSSSEDRGKVHLPPLHDSYLALPPSNTIDEPSWAYLNSLPSDAVALKARLSKDSTESLTNQRFFQLAVDLLTAGPPPRVQAALFRLVSAIPGVRAAPPTTDALGRPADLVTLQHGGYTVKLLFQHTTGAYLGSESLVSDTGALSSYQLVRDISVTETLPKTPTPSLQTPVPAGTTVNADDLPK